jgi:replication factor C subunit 1
LIECIKETQIPIICICDNKFDQSIKSVLPYCVDMKMKKPTYQEVYPLMYDIVMKEKIRVKESQIKNLYEQSKGDIRFMLNTLQFRFNFNNTKTNDVKKQVQSSNVFETTGKLLSMDENIESKYETYWLSNDLHTLMVQENYINNALGSGSDVNRKLQNISYAADALSDVDLFDKMVNMTNWEFEPHVAMNTINATSKCNKKALIKFPQFLGRTSTIYKNRKNKHSYLYEFSDLKKTEMKEMKQTTKITTTKKSKNSESVNKEKKPRGRPKKNIST